MPWRSQPSAFDASGATPVHCTLRAELARAGWPAELLGLHRIERIYFSLIYPSLD